MSPLSRFVLVANRLPVRWDEETSEWQVSPGGLVSALTPVLRERDGVWVGWTGIADFQPAPFDEGGIHLHPVPVHAAEVEPYYHGFCNGTLWPLYHNAIRSPEFHRHWWWPYHYVNRRFADVAAKRLAPEGVCWVQDYQMQLVPAMLREHRPGATIGFFLHIPFPPVELFAYLPWRHAVIEGLLGSDVVAFQTRQSLENFADAARMFGGAERHGDVLRHEGRRIRLQASPISIDTEKFERLAADPEVERMSADIRSDVGPGRKIVLGVDRLDYTKGIGIRLKAVQTFFQAARDMGRLERGREPVLIQLSVPSREEVSEYALMREEVEGLVGRINGELGRPGWTPITYMYRQLAQPELVAYYRAADVMLVTPLADGMNLVAKEYVATRLDDTGTLVLSEFAGAAAELEKALLVNPMDVDGLAHRLLDALALSPVEQRGRMATMRRAVRENDVFAWSRRCLEALEEEAG
ncbi:MAG: trehalose-6-phosphate synthase [Gemmatimonadota bacterium]|nr:trehalose-6-phosphate synthase [Gemmatimonadota bacterium]